MTNLLIKLFIKDNQDTENPKVRTAYGVLSSCVGIFFNVLLFGSKLIIGIMLNSISVTADAFNNLSDAASSIISFIGVILAGKPADEDHPFGHGRIEYISALIVALLVIQVGISFFKDAVAKIMNPEDISFQMISVIILCASIAVKLWLGFFYKKLGKKINSSIMMASATDSLSDVFTTFATILALLIYRFTGLNLDGVVGLIVSIVVMWAGVGIAKKTLEPLIGGRIDPGLYKAVMEKVESYEGILGSHDLIIHNYGPDKSMATIHAEVSRDVDVSVSHELVDKIERDVKRELDIFLVIHMDPFETQNEVLEFIQKQVDEIITDIDTRLEVHDFRMIDGADIINIFFDLVVPYEYSKKQEEDVQVKILKKLKGNDDRYQCIITVDKGFMSV